MVSPKNTDLTTTRSGADKGGFSYRSTQWVSIRLARVLAGIGGRVVARRDGHVPHAAGRPHGANHVPGLRPAAPQRAEQHHGKGDQPRLEPDQGVLPVAQVHREEVAVHVEALPRVQRVLLVEV